MRIIAGTLKGSTLYLPKNKNTRPLKDMVKESIFNLLNIEHAIRWIEMIAISDYVTDIWVTIIISVNRK